jgi:hypothetical protein
MNYQSTDGFLSIWYHHNAITPYFSTSTFPTVYSSNVAEALTCEEEATPAPFNVSIDISVPVGI